MSGTKPEPESAAPFLSRITAQIYAPVPIDSLVFFRIWFGLVLLLDVGKYLAKGWIAPAYIDTVFHFKYYGFGWVHPLPGQGMVYLFILMAVLASGIAAGFFYRTCSALFGLAFTYVFLLEECLYLNHYYLMILLCFLGALVPANRALSIDALLRPQLRSETVPAWGPWLLRAQLAIVYVYAGLAKFKWDWLLGHPTMELSQQWLRENGITGVSPEAMGYFLSYGGLLLDLFVVPLLLWKRTRLLAFGTTLFFHISNNALFEIGSFPFLMIGATTLFFDPRWPRNLAEWFSPRARRGSRAGRPPSRAAAPAELTPRRRAGLAVIGAYLLLQLLIPLRHHLYPGGVLWTEQGQYFAWHMMLRSKSSSLVYWVTDPRTGERWKALPSNYLVRRQAASVGNHPDMVLQFAHYLHSRLEASGRPGCEVRAEDWVSLNGRRPQLLIDPQVDLARIERGFGHKTWILPLTEPLRPLSDSPEHSSRFPRGKEGGS